MNRFATFFGALLAVTSLNINALAQVKKTARPPQQPVLGVRTVPLLVPGYREGPGYALFNYDEGLMY